MQKQAHLIIATVILITGALVFATVKGPSLQADLSNTGNFPANVPIDDGSPVLFYVPGGDLFHDRGGSVTPMSLGGTITPVINGYVNAIVNINVYAPNGFINANINVSSRLIRTKNGGTNVNQDVSSTPEDAFTNVSVSVGSSAVIAPEDGPSECEATGVFYAFGGSTIDNAQVFRCHAQLASSFHPTAAGTYVDYPNNHQGEDWRWVFEVSDGVNTDFDWETLYVEYDEMIGLYTGSVMEFEPATLDGTPTGIVNLDADNRGNRNIWLGVKTDKESDATAWSCVGGGNPLVSDMHYGYRWDSTDYVSMNVLSLNVAGTGTVLTSDNIGPAHPTLGPYENLSWRFATTEDIGQGLCTLSNIVLTAVPTT